MSVSHLEKVQLRQIFVHLINVSKLLQVQLKSASVVTLRNQKHISQSYLVTDAIFTFCRLNKLIKSLQSAYIYPSSPRISSFFAKSCLYLDKYTKILYRLCACVDLLAKPSDLPPLKWILRQQFWQVCIFFFEIFANSHAFM